MRRNFSNEIELILYCVKAGAGDFYTGRLNNLISDSLDWGFVYEQAAYHGVVPLVYYNLERVERREIIPQDIFYRFKGRYDMSLIKNLLLSEEMVYILNSLNSAGIEAVPIKGVILAEILYSNINLRETSDIDILVKSEDMLSAEKAISRIGYRKHLARYSEGYYRRFHCHMPYERIDEFGRQFFCEMHWALSFPRPNVISFPNIWKTTRRQEINNADMLCLSPEDTFFSLILQLRKYNKPLSLRYICDISRLIKLYKDKINWDYIIDESKNNRLKSTAYYALYSAKEMLDTPMPEDILKKLNPGLIRRKGLQYLIRKKTFSLTIDKALARKYLYVFLRFLIYDRTWDFASFILFIPIEEFARFYSLPLNTKKTLLLYRLRFIYILYRSSLVIVNIITNKLKFIFRR